MCLTVSFESVLTSTTLEVFWSSPSFHIENVVPEQRPTQSHPVGGSSLGLLFTSSGKAWVGIGLSPALQLRKAKAQ